MVEHWSDCAQHNEPAEPNGPCNCGGFMRVCISAAGTRWRYNMYREETTFSTIVTVTARTLEEAIQTPEFKRRRAEFKHGIKNHELRPLDRFISYTDWLKVERV